MFCLTSLSRVGDVTALRDRVEGVIRRWNAYEVVRGGRAVIDFDCAPAEDPLELFVKEVVPAFS